MEPLKPINHYSLENSASVFDEEALTALQLAGRTAAKCNETVVHVNKFTENMTTRQQNHEETTAKRQQTHEETTAKRQQTHEETTNKRLVEMETKVDEIPDRITEATGELVESGALDHVVTENIELLGAQLDNLVNTSTTATNCSTEVIDARVGNGRVTYATLGEALRQQTTNIKPERLNPSGAEWKGDNVIPVDTIEEGVTGWQSGFSYNRSNPPLAGYAIYHYNVKPGEQYLYTNGAAINNWQMEEGVLSFWGEDGKPVIGSTNITQFITCVDTTDWVYRVRIPKGCTTLAVSFDPEWEINELWKVNTTQALNWLHVKEGNIEQGAVTPVNIARRAGTWYRNVEYTRTMHTYKSSNGTTITDNEMTGMCLCTIPDVLPGEVYRIPVGKDVSGSLGNYFVFETADGLPAVRDIASCVNLVNATDYIYDATIPAGCVKFHTACDSVTQLNIQEVCTRVSLPWLKVTEENMEGVELGTAARVSLEYLPGKIDFTDKTVRVYGDSIAAGYTTTESGGTSPTADNDTSPFKRFGILAGAKLIDLTRSTGGWRFSEIASTLVTEADTASDSWFNCTAFGTNIAFVACGVNDFRGDVSLSQVETNLDTIIRSLNTLHDKCVNWDGTMDADGNKASEEIVTKYATGINTIFVLPFHTAMEKNGLGLTLEDYRRVIFRKAVAAGFHVVDGGAFPFDVGTMSFTHGDGIHPSTLGQKIYAGALAQRLI